MIHKVYAWVGRAAFKTGLPLIRGITSGTSRTRILVIDEQGRWLLVKNWLSDGKWNFPGGGMKRKETKGAAAARELHEEVGIQADPKTFKHLGTIPHGENGLEYTVEMMVLRAHKPLTLQRRRYEITEAKWVKPDYLTRIKPSEEVKFLLKLINKTGVKK